MKREISVPKGSETNSQDWNENGQVPNHQQTGPSSWNKEERN